MPSPLSLPPVLEDGALYTRREVAAFLRVSERTVSRNLCLRRSRMYVGAAARWYGRDVKACLVPAPGATSAAA